jgi:hypothetical protein
VQYICNYMSTKKRLHKIKKKNLSFFKTRWHLGHRASKNVNKHVPWAPIVLVISYQDNLSIFDRFVRSFFKKHCPSSKAKNLSVNFWTERDIIEIATRCRTMAASWVSTLSVLAVASPVREIGRLSVFKYVLCDQEPLF